MVRPWLASAPVSSSRPNSRTLLSARTAALVGPAGGDQARFPGWAASSFAGMEQAALLFTPVAWGQRGAYGGRERRGSREAGRAVFVAILLMLAGTLNIIYGIAAIADGNFWVNENHFVIANLDTWGWVLVILGAIQLIAGFSLFAGGTFGRVIGIVAASLGALGALLSIGGAYPFWALGVFAVCLWCLHGLIVLGEPIEEEATAGQSRPRRRRASRLNLQRHVWGCDCRRSQIGGASVGLEGLRLQRFRR